MIAYAPKRSCSWCLNSIGQGHAFIAIPAVEGRENGIRFITDQFDRAVGALSGSALALDVYTWLAQRLHRVPAGKPQFVPWTGLYDQFGQGYTRIRDFRRRFLETLRQVQAVYPQSRLSADERGITLEQSPPPVAGKPDRLMLG
jgi:hypothetical protein